MFLPNFFDCSIFFYFFINDKSRNKSFRFVIISLMAKVGQSDILERYSKVDFKTLKFLTPVESLK